MPEKLKTPKSNKRAATTSYEEKSSKPMSDPDNMSNSEDSKESGMQQWSVHDSGTVFALCPETTPKLPAGVYRISQSNNLGIYLSKNNAVLSDELLKLPIPECVEIIDDIRMFWDKKTRIKFDEYKTVYKRGIIVYGPPGNGKSYMMQVIIKDLIESGGVVLTLDTNNCIELFVSFIHKFRDIEPTRQLVVIMEDIDNVLEGGQSTLSALMNILDGVNQIDNVVYLATTNYPEKLQARIGNRPSRFDRVYNIKSPNKEVRQYFMEHKMHKADLESIDMDKWLNATEGLSLAHIKELIVSVIILGKKFEDVITHFDSMKAPKNSRGAVDKIGFGS